MNDRDALADLAIKLLSDRDVYKMWTNSDTREVLLVDGAIRLTDVEREAVLWVTSDSDYEIA